MDVNHCSQDVDQLSNRLATAIRREQIAAAALKLIGSVGLEGFSIAGVAKEVGLVPSAIYRHFTGKSEVLDAVNGLIRDRLLGLFRSLHREGLNPMDRLSELLRLHVELIKTNSGIPQYVFSVKDSARSSSGSQHLYETVNLYLAKVAVIFEDGQATGQIRKDLDATTLAFMFFGLLQSSIFLNHLNAGEFDVEAKIEQTWSIFCSLILSESQH